MIMMNDEFATLSIHKNKEFIWIDDMYICDRNTFSEYRKDETDLLILCLATSNYNCLSIWNQITTEKIVRLLFSFAGKTLTIFSEHEVIPSEIPLSRRKKKILHSKKYKKEVIDKQKETICNNTLIIAEPNDLVGTEVCKNCSCPCDPQKTFVLVFETEKYNFFTCCDHLFELGEFLLSYYWRPVKRTESKKVERVTE